MKNLGKMLCFRLQVNRIWRLSYSVWPLDSGSLIPCFPPFHLKKEASPVSITLFLLYIIPGRLENIEENNFERLVAETIETQFGVFV
jgi:hypothetical protein